MRVVHADANRALAGVSRSSLYQVAKPPDACSLRLQRLVDELYMAFPYYGTRRVSQHLRREGHDVGRDMAHGLMAAVRWTDNRFIERLWRSMKYETVYLEELATGRHARGVIASWLDHDNHRPPAPAFGAGGENPRRSVLRGAGHANPEGCGVRFSNPPSGRAPVVDLPVRGPGVATSEKTGRV